MRVKSAIEFVIFAFAIPQSSPCAEVSVEAARREAEGMHAIVESLLHAVHDRFYREDEGMPLPAAVFREEFAKVAKKRGVTLRWLAVEGVAMNVDHEPRNDFEKKAKQALSDGAKSFERIDTGVYRRVGAVMLTNHCLKCHIPNRTSLEDRTAGLLIEVPLADLQPNADR